MPGVYKSFYDFAIIYCGIDNLLTGSGANPATFKSLYTIHVFDVLKQSEQLTESVVDLIVMMEFSENVPANTQTYALVISDRMLKDECLIIKKESELGFEEEPRFPLIGLLYGLLYRSILKIFITAGRFEPFFLLNPGKKL